MSLSPTPMSHSWIWSSLLVASRVTPLASAQRPLLTGDLDVWDGIFASRSHEVLLDGPANGLFWTEGPLLLGDDLIFSDPVGDRIYSVDLSAAIEEMDGSSTWGWGRRSEHLRVVKERSGESPEEERRWRAEPGGNGMAALPSGLSSGGRDGGDLAPSEVLLCQQGARRLVAMDPRTGETTRVIASEYGDRRLNGPNDVRVRVEEGGDGVARAYAYFTDPVYAWLEKDRFKDLPYLDERVRTDGPGRCGVYRVGASNATEGSPARGEGAVWLVTEAMRRPNGIGFAGDDLVVSECCQGSHLDGCTSGISRWDVLHVRPPRDGSVDHLAAIKVAAVRDYASPSEAAGGCADVFAVLEDSQLGEGSRVLLASCFGGLCVVDLERGIVAARMWTERYEGGCRISNVVVGEGRVFLTGNCGILTLPLSERRYVTDKIDNEEGKMSHAEL